MVNLTREQAAALVVEINAIAPGTAKVTMMGESNVTVQARMAHPRTGTSAMWLSCYVDSIPTAAEIVAGLRGKLGLAAKRAARAIRAEKEAS